MKRSGFAVRSACLALALATLPAAAQAATVEAVHVFHKAAYTSTELDYRAAPGERNEVVVSSDGSSAVVTDTAPLVPGRNCWSESATTVRCSLTLAGYWDAPKRLLIDLGDGDDSARVAGADDALLSGGPGDDHLTGLADAGTSFRGGRGED